MQMSDPATLTQGKLIELKSIMNRERQTLLIGYPDPMYLDDYLLERRNGLIVWLGNLITMAEKMMKVMSYQVLF